MTFEQLVGEALHAADDYQPSPDLFAKVQRSIDEDGAHRERVRRTLRWTLAAIVAALVYVAVVADFAGGTVTMSFAALDVLVTTAMVVTVLVVGPAIRRFGQTYEGDVFDANPETGRSVLRLLDISYYLIFGSYILMTIEFNPVANLGVALADWVRGEFIRMGGLLMLMGILHIALLLALPIVGLIFSANERTARIAGGAVSTDPGAGRIGRVVAIASWIVAGFVALSMTFFVLEILLFGALG